MVCGALLTSHSHVLLLVISVGKAIFENTIDESLVAVLGSVTEDWEVVWCVGHRLCAAGDDDICVSSHDGLSTEDDSLGSGRAHLIDSGGDSGLRETALDGALAGWVLAQVGGENVAEENLLDVLWLDGWDTLDGGLDGLTSKLGGGEGREGAVVLLAVVPQGGRKNEGRVRDKSLELTQGKNRLGF